MEGMPHPIEAISDLSKYVRKYVALAKPDGPSLGLLKSTDDSYAQLTYSPRKRTGEEGEFYEVSKDEVAHFRLSSFTGFRLSSREEIDLIVKAGNSLRQFLKLPVQLNGTNGSEDHYGWLIAIYESYFFLKPSLVKSYYPNGTWEYRMELDGPSVIKRPAEIFSIRKEDISNQLETSKSNRRLAVRERAVNIAKLVQVEHQIAMEKKQREQEALENKVATANSSNSAGVTAPSH